MREQTRGGVRDFAEAWRFPYVRFCHRLITTVLGCVFMGELLWRIVLIYTLPAALVLVVSPIAMGALTVFTIVWSFSYGHKVRMRAMSELS